MSYAISVEGLSKHFNGLKAVDDITFRVREGGIFAFLGPNGAGKSTTIKMLTTLLKPTSGKLSVNGFDCLERQYDVRASIGIVFQDQSLDEQLTAYEHMVFHAALYKVPKNLRAERISNALDMVGLWNRRNDFVRTFSGGMKRRLEIARGLIHHPKILFLDEPTLGLDPQTRNAIWEHIKVLNSDEGVTIFMTTHYMPEAEAVADEIAIIDVGRIVIQGKPAEIEAETKAKSLEEAFLKLTGYSIREEHASSMDRMRMRQRIMPR
ncbi:MAG: ATP-binding cassette domain-containing protein [Candidatus Altiarchaeota archaeon]